MRWSTPARRRGRSARSAATRRGERSAKVPTTRTSPAATAPAAVQRPGRAWRSETPARRIGKRRHAGARMTGSACRRDRNLAQKSRSWRGWEARSSERRTSPIRCQACQSARSAASRAQASHDVLDPAGSSSPSTRADKRSFAESSKPSIAILFLQIYRLKRRLAATSPDYQRSPSRVSSSGRSRAAMASRALKIRERTVPIGQFISSAISS